MTSSPLGRMALCAGLATATAVLAVTPASAAPNAAQRAATSVGSIVFLKKANVWIARGDGSHVRPVTQDGTAQRPYRSPSESDTGIIVASHGDYIVRMTQHGHVLNRINPPRLRNSAGEPMDGTPVDVSISPNGTWIAWSFVRYSCPIGADCMVRYATGYTLANRYKKAGRSVTYRAPSWVTNKRTMLSGGFLAQVMLQDPSTGTKPKHWFDDHQLYNPDTDLADGEVSPNGRYVAQIRGYKKTSAITWYRVNGNARTGTPSLPTPLCVTPGEAAHASPTWSPNSRALAWQGSDGIWIQPDVSRCTTPTRLAIKGGSRPDWSAAPLR